MVVSTAHPLKPKRKKKDHFNVGDLVTCLDGKLVYMLLPKDYSLPRRTGSGTLRGVCVWSAGGRDKDGDCLPTVGCYHDNLGEKYLKLFTGTVELYNAD